MEIRWRFADFRNRRISVRTSAKNTLTEERLTRLFAADCLIAVSDNRTHGIVPFEPVDGRRPKLYRLLDRLTVVVKNDKCTALRILYHELCESAVKANHELSKDKNCELIDVFEADKMDAHFPAKFALIG